LKAAPKAWQKISDKGLHWTGADLMGNLRFAPCISVPPTSVPRFGADPSEDEKNEGGFTEFDTILDTMFYIRPARVLQMIDHEEAEITRKAAKASAKLAKQRATLRGPERADECDEADDVAEADESDESVEESEESDEADEEDSDGQEDADEADDSDEADEDADEADDSDEDGEDAEESDDDDDDDEADEHDEQESDALVGRQVTSLKKYVVAADYEPENLNEHMPNKYVFTVVRRINQYKVLHYEVRCHPLIPGLPCDHPQNCSTCHLPKNVLQIVNRSNEVTREQYWQSLQ
jgi:hypothetical protein